MSFRRRTFLTVLAVAAAVWLTFPQALSAEEDVTVPVLGRVVGDVKIRAHGAGEWIQAEGNMVLEAGDKVWAGPGGRAEIRHATGTVRLFENTVVTVPSIFSGGRGREIRRIDMDRGTGLFRVSPEGTEGGFEVRTRHLIAGVKGTTFGVVTGEETTRVAVYAGLVEVTDLQGSEESRTEVGKGRSLTVVDGRGFDTVERFKRRNDWKNWDKGKKPGIGSTAPNAVPSRDLPSITTRPADTRDAVSDGVTSGYDENAVGDSFESTSESNDGDGTGGAAGNTN